MTQADNDPSRPDLTTVHTDALIRELKDRCDVLELLRIPKANPDNAIIHDSKGIIAESRRLLKFGMDDLDRDEQEAAGLPDV